MSSSVIYNSATREDLNCPIVCIRLVGSVDNSQLQNIPYHWRFYLVIAQNGMAVKSVVFDMTPGGDGVTGLLVVKTRDAITSRAQDKLQYDVQPGAGMTPMMFFERYISQKRHQFRFNNQGKGCLYHTFVVLYDMEAVGISAQGTTQGFRDWIASGATVNARLADPLLWSQGSYY